MTTNTMVRKTSWLYMTINPNPAVRRSKQIINKRLRLTKNHRLNVIMKTKRIEAKRSLWDSNTNLVKEYRQANKYRYRQADRIISYFKTHQRIAPEMSLFLYSGIVTFKNCKTSKLPNGKPVILTENGHNAFKVIKSALYKLNDYFKGDYSARGKYQKRTNRHAYLILTAIEDTIFKGMKENRIDIHNIHAHILFDLLNSALPINDKKFSLWKNAMDYINNFFSDYISISIRSLMNYDTQTPVVVDKTTTRTDWKTIYHTVLYDLKQQKLPLPKSKIDYYSAKNYPKLSEAIVAILNTIPKGMRLHTVLNFKRRERKLDHILTNMIYKALTLSGNLLSVLINTVKSLVDFKATAYLDFKTNRTKPPP